MRVRLSLVSDPCMIPFLSMDGGGTTQWAEPWRFLALFQLPFERAIPLPSPHDQKADPAVTRDLREASAGACPMFCEALFQIVGVAQVMLRGVMRADRPLEME